MNTWLSLTILFHFSRLVDDLESSEDEPRDCNFFEEHIFKPSLSTSTNPSRPGFLARSSINSRPDSELRKN